MFERFTDRARRVVVLAQEEARFLNHGYIGTEHLLLGLLREGQGIAAKALTALDVDLHVVRDRVREIIGEGNVAEFEGHIPFTPRSKRVLELSLREALQLGHNYIGTEHILLGLVREGEGVGAQILAALGADLNRVRQQVIGLLHGSHGQATRGGRSVSADVTIAGRAVPGRRERTLVSGFRVRLSEIESRLAAVEQRVGFGPDVSDIDKELVRVLGEKHAAADAQDYERAAELRDAERRLTAEKAAKQGEWSGAHPDLVAIAETVERLGAEVAGLRQLLSEHGIDPRPTAEPPADGPGDPESEAG